MILDWQLLSRDGALLAVLASAWVMGALRYNPRLFLRHYPKEIREATAPPTVAERETSKLVGLPFLALLIGVPIWSTLTFAYEHPAATFLDQAIHGFGVSLIFNVVDFLVLDIFWLGLLQPKWAMIPGTDEIKFKFNTPDHVRGFFFGAGMAAIIGLVAALIGRI